MKKFVFTLQSLYDIALSMDKQQKIQMQKIETKLRKLMQELNDLQSAQKDLNARHAAEMRSGMQADRLQQYSRYFENLKETIALQKDQIKETEAEKEKCLQEQIKTQKEIKTYEKLRESQYAEYLLEQKKDEEKTIGDIVSYKVAAN